MENQSIILADGRKLGYAEYGRPNGSPVFFFHGTPGARFHPVNTILHEMVILPQGPSIRLIAPERPGYGLSDPKPERTLQDWTADMEELTDQLGIEHFSLVAVSGGAPYALACSQMLPQRIVKTAIISGLGPVYLPELMEGLTPGEQGAMRAAIAMPNALASFTEHVQANPAAFVQGVFAKMPKEESRQVPQELLEIYTKLAEESTKRPDGMISDYQNFRVPWNIDWEQIRVPIHFWHSDTDQSVPLRHAACMVNLIEGAGLTVLSGHNHYIATLAALPEVLTFIK